MSTTRRQIRIENPDGSLGDPITIQFDPDYDVEVPNVPVEPDPVPDPTAPPAAAREMRWTLAGNRTGPYVTPIGDDWYPNDDGVLLEYLPAGADGDTPWVRSTHAAARPGGYDRTGPREDSEFHFYENGWREVQVGEVWRATYTVDGVTYVDQAVYVGPGSTDPHAVDGWVNADAVVAWTIPPTEPVPDPVDPVEPPPPNPDPEPAPVPPSGDVPFALTLSPANTGLDRTLVTAAAYGMHLTGSADEVIRGLRLDCRSKRGKAILAQMSGHYRFENCDLFGGEDVIHQNGVGHIDLYRTAVHDMFREPSAHSDAAQQSSGGRGGTLYGLESLFVAPFRMSNAALQLNVGQGAELDDCGFSGGGFSVYRDNAYKGDVILRRPIFGWNSYQFAPWGGSIDIEDPIFWDPRDMWPRTREPNAFDPHKTDNNRGDIVGPIIDASGRYLGPPNGTPVR